MGSGTRTLRHNTLKLLSNNEFWTLEQCFQILFARQQGYVYKMPQYPRRVPLLTGVFKLHENFIVTYPNRHKLKVPQNIRHNWVSEA